MAVEHDDRNIVHVIDKALKRKMRKKAAKN